MAQPNDDLIDPPEPGRETKIRFAKSRDTTLGADEDRVDPPIWKPGDVVQGFMLERLLGSGVTSSVYRARELETDRRYALKILRTRCEQTRTASRLGFRRMMPFSHPSLVHVDRIFSFGDYIGFTMEEVVGKRLVEVINRTRGEDRSAVFELAMRLLHDIGGALQTLHDAGLVHRDVKPENIIVEDTGQARLIDYGLVGSYDPESDPDARRNYLAGTYWYMAPESISKQMYPPACDVYALGSVVLELIANRSKLPKEQLGVSLGQSIGDVRSFLPLDTPADLADLLCDMLDPSIQNRPVAARLVQAHSPSSSHSDVATNFRRGRLLGREREMAIAERWVHSVVAGRPSRLHISGDSGVGKTWFVSELLRRIRSNAWFQVFDSTCSNRAAVPLQAFDGMADEIARRYLRDDREPIRLSPRHALLVRQAFPSLRAVLAVPDLSSEDLAELLKTSSLAHEPLEVITGSEQEIANRIELARSDSLAAGVELVNAMCEYGPLFLIIDDVQWADQDSINVLDQLLSNAKGDLGIVSVGRLSPDRFRASADCDIDLQPLADRDAIELLRSLLCVDQMHWKELALARLAELGGGNAHRLTQLAACIRHDQPMDWHDRLIAGPIEIEAIWQNRLQRLSPNAKAAIETLATAGGRTRMRDLTRASGLLDRCDAAVNELLHLQLIVDESPKADAISIVHDRVACRILHSMEPQRFGELHGIWANYLITCAHEPWRAARIAGHWIDAGQPETAIPYIIQAARDAEARFAFTEAARWHLRAAKILSGTESLVYLRQALKHFEDAGQPAEAANLCHELLAAPDPTADSHNPLPLLHRLANNLFRCGRSQAALQVVEDMTTRLRGEVGDPELSSQARDIYWMLNRVVMALDIGKARAWLAAAFRAAGAPEPSRTSEMMIRGAVDVALLGCRNPGARRKRSTAKLERSIGDATGTGHPQVLAIAESGMAYRHLLACDWASTVSLGTRAADAFGAGAMPYRFDYALAKLPMLWSFLWLGRLRDLRSSGERLVREVHERNDEFLNQIIHTGPGCALALMDDDEQSVRAFARTYAIQCRPLHSSWLNLFQGFAPILNRLYKADSPRALRYHQILVGGPRQAILKQVQLPRILSLQLEGILHLRVACAQPVARRDSIATVERVCDALRRERIPYAQALAKLFSAQACEIIGDKERCLELYDQAADVADSLDLVPFRLAAVDRNRMVRGENHFSELKRFLAAEGVKSPDKFARLYCGMCA